MKRGLFITASLVVSTASCGAGCGGAELAPAPLAEVTFQERACRVAASANAPLVTEWPASEKANLESQMNRGVVVVAYSGCEMRVLDECRVDGQYGFQPTTVATDTVEITSADELYAKLPLGAVSLEGELAQRGRLAVRTTVSGQRLLTADVDPEALSSGAACDDATHVVERLSVGAYELLSGSELAGGASVESSMVGVEGGGRTERRETVMRSAGRPEACRDAEIGDDCRSPLQVFLAPIPSRSPAAKQADAVPMRFVSDDADEEWLLRRESGEVECRLPCERWIGPESDYFVQRQGDDPNQLDRVPVSKRVPYDPGTQLDAVALGTRGNVEIPFLLAALGILGTNIGIPLAISLCTHESKGACAAGAAVAGGSALMLGGSLVWALGYNRREPELQVRLRGVE